jgi:hypothetical protein
MRVFSEEEKVTLCLAYLTLLCFGRDPREATLISTGEKFTMVDLEQIYNDYELLRRQTTTSD